MKFGYDKETKKKLEWINQMKNVEKVWEQTMSKQREFNRTSYENHFCYRSPDRAKVHQLQETPEDLTDDIFSNKRQKHMLLLMATQRAKSINGLPKLQPQNALNTDRVNS